jgi:hypothetical protein
VSSYECEDLKRTYSVDTQCCSGTYDTTFDNGWPEAVAAHSATQSYALANYGSSSAADVSHLDLASVRTAIAASIGNGDRATVGAAMTAAGYDVHTVNSTDGYEMNVFVYNASRCSVAVFLELYPGGNIFGSPSDTLSESMKAAASEFGGCHVVPYVRNLYDLPNALYVASSPYMPGTIADAVAAYDWVVRTYLSCDICDTKFVIGGASGGAGVAMLIAPTVVSRSAFRKVDMVVGLAPQIACDAYKTASFRKYDTITTDWNPAADKTTWSGVTDPATQCPEKFSTDVYAAFSHRYFIGVTQLDGFLDASLNFVKKIWRGNIPAYFVSTGQKVGHSMIIGKRFFLKELLHFLHTSFE